MEIKELRSTLVVLFPVDEFDFKALSDEAFSARINKEYGCARVENPFSVPLQIIAYGPGKIVVDSNTKIIDRIVIEERKITLILGGSSSEIRVAMDNLLGIVSAFETRHEPRKLVPVIEVDETVCIAKLNFNFTKIISGSAGEHLADTVASIPNTVPKGFAVQVIPSAIRYRIAYRGENEALDRHHIVLNEKVLSLEIREGTDPKEQVFFASGPLKSDEMLKLLHSLEEKMA
jgi:hypothetical protein